MWRWQVGSAIIVKNVKAPLMWWTRPSFTALNKLSRYYYYYIIIYIYIYIYNWENKKCKNWHLHLLIFAIKWDHCENCTPWPCPTFTRSNICNANISETVRAGTKMHWTIYNVYIDTNICHWMTPVQKLYSMTYFSMSNIWNLNISETVIAGKKGQHLDFVILRHWRTQLQKLCSMTLTYFAHFKRVKC